MGSEMKAMLDFEPNTGALSNEPSLRAVLRLYYAEHFGSGLADQYVEKYISTWNRRSEPRGDSPLAPEGAPQLASGGNRDPTPSSAAGAWVTVPREPTEAMIDAGIDAVDRTNPYPEDVANNVWAAMIASAPKAEVEGWRPTHRHVKRGTEYEVLGMGAIQSGNGLLDGDVVVIYRAKDGMLWARDREEFFDGRFERLPAPPPTRDTPTSETEA